MSRCTKYQIMSFIFDECYCRSYNSIVFPINNALWCWFDVDFLLILTQDQEEKTDQPTEHKILDDDEPVLQIAAKIQMNRIAFNLGRHMWVAK